jgi:hypothetical protein
LTDELELLQRAQAALSAGRPDDVLALARTHARRYPDSALAEERDALQMLARCHDGVDAPERRLAQRFVKQHPDSPHTPRVEKACLR